MPIKQSMLAVEAIDFQGRSNLYERLTALFEDLRKATAYDGEAFAQRGFAAAVEEETGIAVRFNVANIPFHYAAVKVPSLDKNHPLIANFMREHATNEDLEAVRRFSNHKLAGVVDRKDAKVYGGFTNLVAPIYLSTGLLKDEAFTAGELAAITLHEIGHVYSYFERLVELVISNYAIESATNRILKLNRDVDRVDVLMEFDKYVGVTVPDKETVVKTDNRGVLFTHLVCEVMRQRRNEEGDELYSYRAFEFSADQFATRHGAGRDLVKSLDRLNRKQWFNSTYMSWPLHIFIELAKVTLIVAGISFLTIKHPFTAIVHVGALMSARPLNKLYDDPMDRFSRIEREMVAELKNRDMPKTRREELLADLAFTRELTKGLQDKPGWLEAIWSYVIPSGNASRKRIELQQQLERLAHNDLFVASARYQG